MAAFVDCGLALWIVAWCGEKHTVIKCEGSCMYGSRYCLTPKTRIYQKVDFHKSRIWCLCFIGHDLGSDFWRKNVHNTGEPLRGLSLPSKFVVR